MKESQLIGIMKEPLNEVVDQVGLDNLEGAFHSKMIAYSIWKFRTGKITESEVTNKNNIVGIFGGEKEPKSYSNIKECILDFIQNNPIGRNGKTNSCLDAKFILNEYDSIAKKYNLYNIDKEYLANNNKSIIDLDEDKSSPSVDLYTVKDSDGREIMKTSNLEEAKSTKNEGSNRTVENSRNKIIDNPKEYKSKSAVNVVLKTGSKIECNNLNMYYKITDTVPGRSITGDYYLFDGRVFNNRYAICMKPELAGKDKSCVIGFVNVADLKK